MDATKYAEMGERARQVASSYDYKVLTERLVTVLETV